MKRQIALISAVTLVVLLLLTGSLTAYQSIRAEQWRKQEEKERQALFVKVTKPEIRPALLTPNKNSRPQTKLKKVNGIVVHYTANPGTDAMANRNYFESRKDKPDQTKYKVSSHFIIGLDGTIIQCIPLDEISYASNDRNCAHWVSAYIRLRNRSMVIRLESLLLVRQGKKLWEWFKATLIYRELHRFRQSECHVLVRCLYLVGFPVRRWMLY